MSKTFADSPVFPDAATVSLANPQLRRNLARATTTIREKRNARVAEMPNWEELRRAGEAIKTEALEQLPELLTMFEERVTAAGGTVHWACDAREAQTIVTDLVQGTGARSVVKIKSMTTAEIDLNGALERSGIAAFETDLAELIVQLGDDLPSHIVVPAIHRNRDEVRDIFQQHMGDWGRPAPENLTNDPAELATAARLHLREKFLTADVAISGANFLIADTGSVAIVESEGNGRMCLTLPNTLITIAGVDKILPRFEDLDVFFQVLPRSATGERMNPYNSVWTGTTTNDGPQNFHVILLDNGRSAALSDRVGRAALRCIRCAACLNVCPVYERVGGHAYGSVYPGPIGAILTPQLNHITDRHVAASLPFASTLCGACFDACPVRIDIPKLLVHLRGEVVKATPSKERRGEARAMSGALWLFRSSRRLTWAARLGAGVKWIPGLARLPLPGWAQGWTKFHTLPLPTSAGLRAKRRGRRTHTDQAGTAHTFLAPATAMSTSPRGLGEPMPADEGEPREKILAALRQSLGDARPAATTPRDYRLTTTRTPAQIVELFIDRLRDYHATVSLVREDAVASTVATILQQHHETSVIIPSEELRHYVADFSGHVVVDDGVSAEVVNGCDAVLTTSTVAVAETGTIILNTAATEGRRLISLLPDHHLVIVSMNDIVASVPEAMPFLNTDLPQTWFSGPSATSDIELSRVEGVHGPRRLDVIIVDYT